MKLKLFITANQVKDTTSISGTTDNGLLSQKIYYAQITDIYRVLGQKLYDKIYADIEEGNPLTGEYATIFNKFIIDMHVFFAAHYFILFNEVKASNTGNNLLTMAGQPATNTIDLAERYKNLAVSVEDNFRDYMETISIPEWGNEEKSESGTNLTGFY